MLASWLAFAACSCAVPRVTFYGDDASQDAGDQDATASDAMLGDAIADAADAAQNDAGCAPELLGDASVCCGSLVCSGDCAGQCPACQSRCTSTQLCCVRGASVTCHPPAGGCP